MLEQALESARDVDPELRRRLEAELLCAAQLDAGTLTIARRVHDSPTGEHPRRHAGRTDAARRASPTSESCAAGRRPRWPTLAARALDGGLIAEQTGDSGLVMDAGFALVTAGDLQRADRCWDDALADVRRRGSVIGFARTSCLRAMLRLAQGPLLDAESDARNAIEAAWEPGYRVARMAHGPLVEALVAQGELAAADAALTTAGLDGDLADSYMLNFVLFARGKLRLAQGRDDEGDRRSRGARPARDQVAGPQPRRLPVPLAARLAGVPRGRRARSPPRRSKLARAWGAAGALGRALRAHGLVTGGDSTELRPERRGARRIAVAARAGPHSLIELGAAIRRAGHRSRGPRAAARREWSSPTPAPRAPLVARARRSCCATGARPRRVVRSGIDALTATERRVAEMAADGMTNRQIAQALFVTTRTVEVHLTHAYQKLGVSSRKKLPAALG